MTVYLAQCLCGPNRHAILAAADECTDEAEARGRLVADLRAGVTEALRDQVLNPWCGLCGAETAGWLYEVARTPYATLAQATPALLASEAENIRTALTLGTHGPDKPTRH